MNRFIRRVFILLLLVLPFSFCLCAIDVDDLYQKVLTTAPTILELQEQRKNELLSELVSKSEGGFKWTLGFSDLSYTPMIGVIKAPSTEVSFTSPESPNQFSYEGKISTAGFKIKPEIEDTSVSLRVGFSKGFSIKNWDTTDYTSSLSVERTINEFSVLMLNFENRFLNDVISILNLDRVKYNLGTEYLVLFVALSDDIGAGRLEENSPEYYNRLLEKDLKKVELDQAEAEYESRLEDFKATYGTDYEEVDSCYDYEPVFEPDTRDSFSVRAAMSKLKEVEQKIAEKKGTATNITITGGVEPTVNFAEAKAYDHTSINFDLGASISIGNLSFNVSVSSVYSDDPSDEKMGWGDGPTITLSGSWSNSPSSLSAADDAKLREIYNDDIDTYQRIADQLAESSLKKRQLEIYQLQNDLNEAQKELLAATNSYLEKSMELINELNAHKTSAALLDVKIRSKESLVRQLRELYTSDQLEEMAEYYKETMEYSGLIYDKVISNIEAKILLNKIEMMSLY